MRYSRFLCSFTIIGFKLRMPCKLILFVLFRDRLVSLWLRITSISTLWVRILPGTLDYFMRGSYPASLRKVSDDQWFYLGAWNNARMGTWGLHPPVKLENRHTTLTVLVPKNKKTQPKCSVRNSIRSKYNEDMIGPKSYQYETESKCLNESLYIFLMLLVSF